MTKHSIVSTSSTRRQSIVCGRPDEAINYASQNKYHWQPTTCWDCISEASNYYEA